MRRQINQKKNNGITLIVLVITIIVLLILAGVSIVTLTGDNGILTKASEAREQAEVAGEKEAIGIAYNGVMANHLRSEVSYTDLQTELRKNGYNATVTDNGNGTLRVFFEDTQNAYKVENGVVSEYIVTEQKMNLETGTIQTINSETKEIISEEKVAILKTMKFSTSATEIYFMDSGEQSDPKQYLIDTYGIDETNIENIAYNDNCLPVYMGNNGTIYYVASQGNTYLNSEEEGGGYCLFGRTGAPMIPALQSLIKLDLTNLNTTYATNMAYMFAKAGHKAYTTGEYLKITYGSNFDTSNVLTMESMYAYVGIKNIILPDSFNTIKVTNMSYMFRGYTSRSMLETIDVGENFDTSNVTNMSNMFLYCGMDTLISIDLGEKFDTSQVTNMNSMFFGCSYVLPSLNLGKKFNTTNVTEHTNMMMGCGREELTEIIYEDTISNFETNCEILISALGNSPFDSWDYKVTCTDGEYSIK